MLPKKLGTIIQLDYFCVSRGGVALFKPLKPPKDAYVL